MANYERIILDLMDRVVVLENEVKRLREQLENLKRSEIDTGTIAATSFPKDEYKQADGIRDTTKYLMNGKKYGKNRLVLAIVQKYLANHPDISSDTLISVFDKSLQGSLGVVRTLQDVKENYGDYERRFFCRTNEILHTATESCVVCTQWGKFNIDNMIVKARNLGMEITEIQ